MQIPLPTLSWLHDKEKEKAKLSIVDRKVLVAVYEFSQVPIKVLEEGVVAHGCLVGFETFVCRRPGDLRVLLARVYVSPWY